jgi:hypothetical protein
VKPVILQGYVQTPLGKWPLIAAQVNGASDMADMKLTLPTWLNVIYAYIAPYLQGLSAKYLPVVEAVLMADLLPLLSGTKKITDVWNDILVAISKVS